MVLRYIFTTAKREYRFSTYRFRINTFHVIISISIFRVRNGSFDGGQMDKRESDRRFTFNVFVSRHTGNAL